MPIRSKIVKLFVLLATVAAACGEAPAAPASGGEPALAPVSIAPGDKLRVVATTSIVGDVAGRVGGDRIALTTLMAPGVDPHSYAPAPADTAAIHDAHLVLANGAGLEEFLAEMIANAGGSAVQVSLSDSLTLRPLDDEHEGEAEAHGEEGLDPHVWFDVQNVVLWVQAIERALSTLDPAGAAAYQANAQAYTGELRALDAWIAGQVAALPEDRRKVVINHPVLGYLAARYGLVQVGAVYPLNPAAEPSAADLAALESTIRDLGVPAVFAENTVSPRLAEQVSRDTGIDLVLLYTDALGRPGSGAASYLEMMRYDVGAIVGALGK